jgi:hypothetical protein
LLITNAPLGAEFEFNNPPHGPNGECFYRVRGW